MMCTCGRNIEISVVNWVCVAHVITVLKFILFSRTNDKPLDHCILGVTVCISRTCLDPEGSPIAMTVVVVVLVVLRKRLSVHNRS